MIQRNYDKFTNSKLGLTILTYVVVGFGFGLQASVWFPWMVTYAPLIYFLFIAISAVALNYFAPVIKKK